MKKIRTHKDAFQAFLAPAQYEIDDEEECVFCQLDTVRHPGELCSCEKYCSVWPACDKPNYQDKFKLVRYVLRYCKDWRIGNIRRLINKKLKAMGYELKGKYR